MNIILLSGGSGKRLWPLSNDVRSKQFIKIFKNDDGIYESMIQRMYRNIKKIDENATITIATAKTQVSAITNQISDDVSISIEPCRKDTFPAIALATAYLYHNKGLSLDDIVIVCPVDPYVDTDYFESLKELNKLAEQSTANLSLIGMEPTYPSAKYGYIIPETKDKVSKVKSFKEKPTEEVAKEYIEKGALWNGGIFAYKIGYLLDIAHKLIDFTDYEDLYNKYETLEKISFDYAVVEKEENIQVLRFSGSWKDLGTWNTLTETVNDAILGNGMMNETCENVHIINELDIPVLCMGLKNVVIATSPEGILVSDKHESSYIKPFVEKLNGQIMFAEKSWGSYKVIDVQPKSLTILVTLNPGHEMKYHSHKYRNEVWTVISGSGKTVIDGVENDVKVGDIINIPIGCKHTIKAITELKVIEVQMGKDINVSDKIKYND